MAVTVAFKGKSITEKKRKRPCLFSTFFFFDPVKPVFFLYVNVSEMVPAAEKSIKKSSKLMTNKDAGTKNVSGETHYLKF